jgi:hypothetical protein
MRSYDILSPLRRNGERLTSGSILLDEAEGERLEKLHVVQLSAEQPDAAALAAAVQALAEAGKSLSSPPPPPPPPPPIPPAPPPAGPTDEEIKALANSTNKAGLMEIAKAEGVQFETDNNKVPLARKILLHRAAMAAAEAAQAS